MEAFPFVNEIVSILVTFWSSPNERRIKDPGYDTIVHLWDMLTKAIENQYHDTSYLQEIQKLLQDFQKKPELYGYDVENLFKRLMWEDPKLAKSLEMTLEEYRQKSRTGASVNIERGDVKLKGPNAQVEQETIIDVDNIDLSRYFKSED